MMKNFSQMMKQAQEMQNKLVQMQEKTASIEVEGSSGGGMVKVTLNGKHELMSVAIDPELMKESEKEILEDLIVAAHKDALSKVETQVQKEMESVTGGLSLPGGMKFPF